MPTITPELAFDSYATQNGAFNTSGSYLWLGSNSVIDNAEFAILLKNVNVERGTKITNVPVTLVRTETFNASQSLEFVIGAHKTANATAPNDNADQRGRTMTTARTAVTMPGNTGLGTSSYNAAVAVQEVVNLSTWQSGNSILLLVRPTGGTGGGGGNGGRQMRFSSLQSENPPKVTVEYALPTVSANATITITETITVEATGTIETPEPLVPTAGNLTATIYETITLDSILAKSVYKGNTAFTFFDASPDTHYLVTEAGESYGFAAKVPTLLGGIRSGVSGAQDDAWYPTSGLLTREPVPLEFEAALLDRDKPVLERERFRAALVAARALYLPDGRVFDLWHAQASEVLRDDALLVSCAQKSSEPRHVLLSGTVQAAFETYGSTAQVPVYAVDPAGGLYADILPAFAPQGGLCFGVRSAERGVEGYASVGRAVGGDGTSEAASVTVSYQWGALVVSIYGVETRIRETYLGSYGAALVCYLFWRPGYAHLVAVSGAGIRHFKLIAGTAVPLGQRIITAGMSQAEGFGGFIAPGAPTLNAPFFSLHIPSESEAENAASALYRELTRKGISYEVEPPEISLELFRTDDKAFELAPGESVTFGLGARRVGNYQGPLELTLTTDTLTSSFTTRTDGDTDYYTITLTAPVGTPEAAYTFRAEVKVAGIIEENEGETNSNAPVIMLSSPPENMDYGAGDVIAVVYNVSGRAGAVKHRLYVNGERVTASSGESYRYTYAVPEGQTTVRIEATDAAGNTAVTERTFSGIATAEAPPEPTPTPVVADTEAPVITFIRPEEGESFSAGSTVKLSYSLADNVGVVSHKLTVHERQQMASGDNPYIYNFGITEGTRVIRIEAVDEAGNVGIAERTIYGVGTSTPTPVGAYPSETSYPSESSYPREA